MPGCVCCVQQCSPKCAPLPWCGWLLLLPFAQLIEHRLLDPHRVGELHTLAAETRKRVELLNALAPSHHRIALVPKNGRPGGRGSPGQGKAKAATGSSKKGKSSKAAGKKKQGAKKKGGKKKQKKKKGGKKRK